MRKRVLFEMCLLVMVKLEKLHLLTLLTNRVTDRDKYLKLLTFLDLYIF